MVSNCVLLALILAVCNGEVLRTKVAILGGGMAGVTAAGTLFRNGITDFVIIEAESVLGGRMKEATFGGYTIELGANWIQGIRNNETGLENPIWTLANKHNLTMVLNNMDDVLTYDHQGWFDYTDIVKQAFDTIEQVNRDEIQRMQLALEDLSFEQGQHLRGWKPTTPHEKVADWWAFDFEFADTPAVTSMHHVLTIHNSTYGQWSNESVLVNDPRGFATLVREEAKSFTNADQILYNSTVTKVIYAEDYVKIILENGKTILADYAICTFSLGVLQHKDVQFEPPFPDWKQESIFKFKMATYTKIFLQFPYKFWNDSQIFLYADPYRRGYYPQWQSLSEIGFWPDSHILFVTVVTEQSYVVEAQPDHQTLAEIMAVLRSMYQTEIPEPVNFYYYRWTKSPLYRGSYSNWPVGSSPCQHDNLRRPLGRLHFAGEAYSPHYNGFVQGAYLEGLSTGQFVADRLLGKISAPKEQDYTCKRSSSPSSLSIPATIILVLAIVLIHECWFSSHRLLSTVLSQLRKLKL